MVAELSSGRFLRWLERVVGIEHLLPDPHLQGGGLHLTQAGGWLAVGFNCTRPELASAVSVRRTALAHRSPEIDTCRGRTLARKVSEMPSPSGMSHCSG